MPTYKGKSVSLYKPRKMAGITPQNGGGTCGGLFNRRSLTGNPGPPPPL